MTQRLFVAVVPPEDELDGLRRFVEPRREAESALRWTDDTQWHITLAFMGSVADDRVEVLEEQLAAAASRQQPFSLQLAGAAAIPAAAEARILHAGVLGDVDALSACARSARFAATTAGIEVDGARFRPHLTLARLNRPMDVVRWLRVFDGYRGKPWLVSELVLVRSEFTGGSGARRGSGSRTRGVGRARHSVLASFPLGRSAG